MDNPTDTDNASVPRVLIAGGGIAALEGVLALRAVAGDRINIDVWTTEQDFVFKAQSVAVPFTAGEVRRFPLDRLVASAGGVLHPGRALAVDPGRHSLLTDVGEVSYDVLILALGAESKPWLTGSITFRGPEDADAIGGLLYSVVTGSARRLAFVLPPGPTRHLPLYELALESRNYFSDRGTQHVRLTIVTPETAPFALFGLQAGAEIRDLLAERAIELITSATAIRLADGTLELRGQSPIPADHVVAMATLVGPRIPGIPCNAGGFVPVDQHCRVVGVADVYAVGDMTDFPVKHGGIASEQSDAATEMIAASVGVPIDPTPFHPVMRIQLLTGLFPRYLRLDQSDPQPTFTTQPPWWPSTKVIGRYITPFLSKHLGLVPVTDLADADREVELLSTAGWRPV